MDKPKFLSRNFTHFNQNVIKFQNIQGASPGTSDISAG